jgi:GntR family transcriptional regulator
MSVRSRGRDGGNGLPRVGQGTASLSAQVLEALIQAIGKGTFEDRLPAEDELAESLGVSRTTLRRALQSLEQLGLIDRRPGRGTRVRRNANPNLFALHGLVPFPVVLRLLGYQVSAESSWVRQTDPDASVAERLGRTDKLAVYEVTTLLRANGNPAVAMRERFPDDNLGRELTDGDLRLGSILLLSDHVFTEKIDHAWAAVEPTVAGADDDNLLGLEPGRPLLALRETFYAPDERPLAISDVFVNPEYITFSVFRRSL